MNLVNENNNIDLNKKVIVEMSLKELITIYLMARATSDSFISQQRNEALPQFSNEDIGNVLPEDVVYHLYDDLYGKILPKYIPIRED